MGCDIHIVLERQSQTRADEWIGVWSSDHLPGFGRPLIARRDYGFFAEVAGVRGRSETTHYARNVPEDVSRLAWTEYMAAPTDHHTPSHMSAAEFCAAYKRANPSGKDYRPDFALYDLLGIGDDEGRHRVVFWFDN